MKEDKNITLLVIGYLGTVICVIMILIGLNSCTTAEQAGCSQKLASKPNKIGAYYRR